MKKSHIKSYKILILSILLTILIHFIIINSNSYEYYKSSIVIFVIAIFIKSLFISTLFIRKIVEPTLSLMKRKTDLTYDYYREELKEYSPMITAKLLGKDILSNDVIVAMILYLEETKRSLLPHEKFFLEHKKELFHDIKYKENTKYKDVTIKVYLVDLIENDLRALKLVDNNYYENTGNIDFIDTLAFLIIPINIVFIRMFHNYDTNLCTLILYIEFYSNLLSIIILYVYNISNLKFKMYLTDEGRKYVYKIRAYKRFIKHFSIIGNRTIKEKVLLYSHIRNSILLNLKGNLDKESNLYYKKVIENSNYEEYKDRFRYKFKKIINASISIILFVLFFVFIRGNDGLILKLVLFEMFVLPLIIYSILAIRNPKLNVKK